MPWNFPDSPAVDDVVVFAGGTSYKCVDAAARIWDAAEPVLFVITNLVPATIAIDEPDLTCQVIGVGFTPTCTVLWDGALAMDSAYVSATEMTFTVQPSLETAARSATVEVTDGTDTTPPVAFEFTERLRFPVISDLRQKHGCVDKTDNYLEILGGNFYDGSVIHMDGVAQPTTFMNVNFVSTTMDGAGHAHESVQEVTVKNGNAESNGADFTWVNRPIIATVEPDILGITSTTEFIDVTITGQWFTADSDVYEGQTQVSGSTVVDANTITLSFVPVVEMLRGALRLQDPRAARLAQYTIRTGKNQNPPNDITSVDSVPVDYRVNPEIATPLVPATAAAGSADLTVTMTLSAGTTADAIVLWDCAADGTGGTEVATTIVDGTNLSFTVSPGAEIARAVNVTVNLAHAGHAADDVRPIGPPLVQAFTFT